MDGPRKRSGPATGPLRKVPPASVTEGIVPDHYGIRRQAQARIRHIEEHHRVCSELEQLVSWVVGAWAVCWGPGWIRRRASDRAGEAKPPEER